MLKYICKSCNLECETSVCPKCGNRTELVSSTIFWSKQLNTPVFDNYCFETAEYCEPIASDIRPVFAEERLLLEILAGKPMAYAGKSVWNSGGNRFIVDGKKMILPFNQYIKNSDRDYIIKQINEYSEENQKYVDGFMEQDYIKNFIRANGTRLSLITDEACNYIRDKAQGWEENEMFVSFSGGKDSTVTSHLAMRALNNKNLVHIYGDTTLEYPASKEYLKRLKLSNDGPSIMMVAKNKDQDFNNLCEVIGPPSRVMRWCCTIFKTGAITKKIESTFRDEILILTFQGIRRN